MLPATSCWTRTRPRAAIRRNKYAGMSPHPSVDHGSHEFPFVLALILVFLAYRYLRGWVALRLTSSTAIPPWRGASFFLGLVLVWVACGSSLAAYDHNLLTVHMIKHLLLMTVAPALILLAEPLRSFWIGTPSFARLAFRRVFWRSPVRRFAHLLTRPALCWAIAAITLLAWHVPPIFALGMQSEAGHIVEQISFLLAGLLFWWPLIRPWPSASTEPRWWMLLYLFLATLPCDILSAFLAFSDRVAYPIYFSNPHLFGLSVLADQQCAAALMWTSITLIYLVPAAILCSKLLAPRSSRERDLQRSHFSRA
jgi:putative membrane protein